jgi:hypothetical protein
MPRKEAAERHPNPSLNLRATRPVEAKPKASIIVRLGSEPSHTMHTVLPRRAACCRSSARHCAMISRLHRGESPGG